MKQLPPVLEEFVELRFCSVFCRLSVASFILSAKSVDAILFLFRLFFELEEEDVALRAFERVSNFSSSVSPVKPEKGRWLGTLMRVTPGRLSTVGLNWEESSEALSGELSWAERTVLAIGLDGFEDSEVELGEFDTLGRVWLFALNFWEDEADTDGTESIDEPAGYCTLLMKVAKFGRWGRLEPNLEGGNEDADGSRWVGEGREDALNEPLRLFVFLLIGDAKYVGFPEPIKLSSPPWLENEESLLSGDIITTNPSSGMLLLPNSAIGRSEPSS